MLTNTSLRKLGLSALCTLILVASGCGGGNDSGCTKNSDCTNGQICTNGTCSAAPACSVDADCKDNTKKCVNSACESKCKGVICGSGQTCVATTGLCSGGSGTCTTDADCNDNTKRCDSSGQCVSKCQGISCTGGQTCQPTTGQCGGGSTTCTQNSDCFTTPGKDNGDVCTNGSCIAPQGADCSKNPCDTGLDCLTVQGSTGSLQICYLPCTSTADCTSKFDVCQTSGATANHCDQNLCSSDNLTQYGIQQATYLGACNVRGTGDGTCYGPFVQVQGPSGMVTLGLCGADGTAAPGAACTVGDVTPGDSQLCNAGFCEPATQGATTGTCFGYCDIADGQSCPPIGSQATACAPLGQGLVGVCAPQAANPGNPGDTCTPSTQGQLVCVEDSACIDPTGGSNTTCVQFCDQRTPQCPTGKTCQAAGQGETLLGVCM